MQDLICIYDNISTYISYPCRPSESKKKGSMVHKAPTGGMMWALLRGNICSSSYEALIIHVTLWFSPTLKLDKDRLIYGSFIGV